MRHLSTAALVMGVMLSCAAVAKHHHGEHRHAEAHVHGMGQVNFAVEGKQVHLELDIPGFDILGFESVNSAARREALSKAVEALKQPDLWGFTDAAGCQLQTVSVIPDSHDHHHKGSHSDKDDHGDSHADGHDHHGEQAAHKSTHMDFAATYVYQCAQPKQLKRISTRLFDRFQHSAALKVQSLTDAGQMAGSMTRNQPETRI